MNRHGLSRRQFLSAAGAGLGAAVLQLHAQTPAGDPWNEVGRILSRIKEPSFPNRDFDLKRFPSINDAISACNAAGGGRVVVPPGTFATGPIRLKSRVNLYLSEGATLKFSTDPSQYLPVV